MLTKEWNRTRRTRSVIWVALASLSFAACSETPTELSEPERASFELADPKVSSNYAQLYLWNKVVIGTLPGKTNSRGWDVSDSNVVVGESMNAFGRLNGMPFYWTQSGGIKPLPVVSGTTEGRAIAISDNGLYAAGTLTVNGRAIAVRWQFARPAVGPIIVRKLAPCLSLPGAGTAVNNKGQVVGNVGTQATLWPYDWTCPSVLKVDGTIMRLARGINDLGTIVGSGFQPQRGFYRSPLADGPLPPLAGDSWAAAHAVNDLNYAVGISWRSGVYTAVSWSNVGLPPIALGSMHPGGIVALSDRMRSVWTSPGWGAMTRKGNTTHGLALAPSGINACGDVVGSEGGIAVLYKKRYCD